METKLFEHKHSENKNIIINARVSTSHDKKSVKDSNRKKSKRKKRHETKKTKTSTENLSKSSPIPSTSSSFLALPVLPLSSNEDDTAIKTEPDDETKGKGCDVYFEIDSATLENEDLLNETVSQIEEKILAEEMSSDEFSIRKIVLVVTNNSEVESDAEIKSEPPSLNQNATYCGNDEEIQAQKADKCQDQDETPSTSCSLRKPLRLRKESSVPKENRSNTAAANEESAKNLNSSSSPVTIQRELKKSGCVNKELEELITRVGAAATVLEIDMASSSVQSSKVAILSKTVPDPLLEQSGNVDLPSSIPPPETHKIQHFRCNEDDADGSEVSGQTLLEDLGMLSPSSIKVEMEEEVEDGINSSSLLLINVSNKISNNEVQERLPQDNTTTHISQNIVDIDGTLAQNTRTDSQNTVEMNYQSQPQCSTKMNLRRNRKPTFKLLSAMSNQKDYTQDKTDTCKAKAGSPVPPPPQQEGETFEKRGRGRPKKRPRIDPDLQEPKKMGRPKIIRTEVELEEMRKKKNSQRALKKRMKNQLLREQRQQAKQQALQKLENNSKSNQKTKKNTWRPLRLELHQQAFRNHTTVSSEDILSIFKSRSQDQISPEELESLLEKSAFSVGHGTFDNPYLTLNDEDNAHLQFLCICPACGETFKDVETLSIHKQASHPEICPTCEICGKPVITPWGMVRHKRRHFNRDELKDCYDQEVEKLGAPPPSRNDRLYKCSHCSKILIGWVTMKIHEKIHTEAYSTSCPICSKPIYRKDYLKYHMTTHLGLDEKIKIWKERRAKRAPRFRKGNGISTVASSRNYELLPSSNIRNSQPDNVITTYAIDDKIIYLHEVKAEPSPEKKIRTESANRGPVDCLICGKTFKTVYTLRKHQWTMHSNRSNENPFRTTCPICSRPFERGEYLSKHVRTHMNEKEKQLFSMWSGSWRQFLESFKSGDDIEELPKPRKHRGRPKIQKEIVKVAKKKGRPKKNGVESSFNLSREVRS